MAGRVYRASVLFAVAGIVAGSLAGCGPPSAAGPVARLSQTRRIMGVPWVITVHASDRESGEQAVAAAFTEIERLNGILSDYDADSELSRLSAAAPTAEPVPVGDDLWRVLVAAEAFRERSGGGFDIAVGPLTTLWRQSRQSEKLPRPDKLALARAAVGAGSIELVIERQAVRLPKPGTRLDAGGIGRGYAADRVIKILADHGITSALIDSSGDVLASGPPPGAAGWTIAVAPLRPGGEAESLVLAHAAVATSGDAYQAVEIGGVRYSHIVDPRTGIGVPGPAAVTVVAADATTADALATAASVLGATAGPALIASFPGTSARFAWQEAGASQTLVTPGWPGAGQRPDERPSVSPGPIASPLP